MALIVFITEAITKPDCLGTATCAVTYLLLSARHLGFRLGLGWWLCTWIGTKLRAAFRPALCAALRSEDDVALSAQEAKPAPVLTQREPDASNQPNQWQPNASHQWWQCGGQR